ncbi:hypothetical protein E2C01_012493 [Portunus trituberculatus]|uniref:Uncharacterized protein n=1 Tax=Portunus trituberculatus TaxID=210409 RepID=A0A5B7DE96_PORTR|nr:hypothetical protein [Portunus trituberculatus]
MEKITTSSIPQWTYTHVRDRCAQTLLARLRIGHTYLTQRYLLTRDPQLYCDDCLVPHTVRHLVVECPSLTDLDTATSTAVAVEIARRQMTLAIAAPYPKSIHPFILLCSTEFNKEDNISSSQLITNGHSSSSSTVFERGICPTPPHPVTLVDSVQALPSPLFLFISANNRKIVFTATVFYYPHRIYCLNSIVTFFFAFTNLFYSSIDLFLGWLCCGFLSERVLAENVTGTRQHRTIPSNAAAATAFIMSVAVQVGELYVIVKRKEKRWLTGCRNVGYSLQKET